MTTTNTSCIPSYVRTTKAQPKTIGYKKDGTPIVVEEAKGAAISSGALEYAFVPDMSERQDDTTRYYDGIPTMAQQIDWLASDLNWEKKQKTKPQSFTGAYEFLSNMFLCTVILGDMVFPSAENAYQAMKCKTRKQMEEFQYITPYEARKRGNDVDLRTGWNDIRLKVMKKVLQAKFEDQELANMLLRTEDMFLCELNYWGDTFWGKAPVVETHEVKDGDITRKWTEKKIKGENHLGKLLCEVREEIRKSGAYSTWLQMEQADVDPDWLASA